MLKVAFPFLIALTTPTLAAECARVEAKTEVTLSGTLSFAIFAGPAYEDVTKGDIPEPTYILELDEPQCFTGKEDLAAEGKVPYAHLYVAGDDHPELWQQLRMLIGRHVRVSGREPFAAITGHHHAPVVMAIDSITGEHEDAGWYQGTPATTVMAFYEALEVGQGSEAARFVVPGKRQSGPLSAEALTSFYRNLKTPLKFIDLWPLGDNQYEALYTYETATGRFCNGRAVVTTTKVDDRNLIAGIEAKNGC
jgi:hypothetical protein